MNHQSTPVPSADAALFECTRCGYDLRGLSEDANCPECGAPIVHSKHNLLRYADGDWLRSIVRGMRLAHVGRYSFFILVLVFLLMVITLGALHAWSSIDKAVITSVKNAADEVFRYLFLLAFILMGIGVWIVSAPEPRESGGGLRNVVYRISSAASVPVFGLWLFLASAQPLGNVHWSVQQALIHVCLAVIVVHSMMISQQHDQLNSRLPTPGGNAFRPLATGWRAPLLFTIVVLGVYWGGSALLSSAPGWQPPSERGQQMLCYVVALAWLMQIGHLVALRERIFKELDAPTSQTPEW